MKTLVLHYVLAVARKGSATLLGVLAFYAAAQEGAAMNIIV